MLKRTRPPVGSVVAILLPSGRHAFGRLFRDAAIAVYRHTDESPAGAPIGSRDYRFIVRLEDRAFDSDRVRVVGTDPFDSEDDEWPPPASVTDPITGHVRVYHRGVIRERLPGDPQSMEPAAAWSLHHLTDRIRSL